MPEEFPFFGDARLPSAEPDEARLSAQEKYSFLNQHGVFPPISGLSSPLPSNDIPQPSVEVDLMESNNHDSMFVTPEPEEGCRRLSMPVSVHSTPEVSHRSQFYKEQTLDDDRMMVEEADCSPKSRQIWLISKPAAKTSDRKGFGNTAIKAEREHERTQPDNIIEIQKRLISQHNAAGLHRSGASTLFSKSMARPVSLSQLPKRKPKPRHGTVYQPKSLDDIVDVKVEFETAMRQGEEEVNWMGQHGEDEENEELENLKRLRQSFQRRNNEGSLTDVETIEMMKINQQIELHKRRQEAANRLNLRDAMSVSSDDEEDEGDEGGLRQSRYNQEDEDDYMIQTTERVLSQEAEETAKKQKLNSNKKPIKARRKVAKTAREVEKNRREKEREKERKKRARAALSKRAPSKGKKPKAGKVAGPRAKKQHKSHMKSSWDDRETLQTLLHDLLHSDFAADRQAQGELPDAPEIHETRKEKALHALLASVPDDYDTHRAKTERSDLDKASKHFGHGRVKFANGSWKVKGMKSHLYHHQLLGADWMLSRELGEIGPFGGLLADAMGLGKTLQTLATMVGNPPSKEDIKAKTKATLIVLPASAIRQWQDEIEVHVEPGMFPKIMKYKAKFGLPLAVLQGCDIILTSYAEVMASFPYPSQEDVNNFADKGGYTKWTEKCRELAGDLHKISWYRIVLDEAHAIKNFKSRTSLACQNLCGKYRWALSGTPIQNRLDELFPYLRFLRTKWTRDYGEFRRQFCDPDAKDANARVSVILSIVMRRTMKDKVLGRPIVQLPPIHPDTQHISFSREERVLYRILEDRFRDNLNKHFQQGTAERNYGMFMVLILRLRQCTAHPFLLESTVKDSFNLEDITRLKAEWGRLSGFRQPMYEQINLWMQQSEEERIAAQARAEPTLGPGEKQSFGLSDFGKCFRMGNILESLNLKDLKQRVVCRLCGDFPTDALITDCHHVFCRNCLENYLAAESLRDVNTEYDQCPEPNCRKIFTQAIPYQDLNLPDDEIKNGNRSSFNKSSRKKGKRSPADDSQSESTWLKTIMESEDQYLPPSAKTIALKAKILSWINESPNDKIIIFTQWRMMAKIIGLICHKEDWGHCYFIGDMNLDLRHNTVKRFHTDPNIKIMIAGLKCGGQALNLTCANRVISVDLWWNHSIEQQAFGRVFRIGQHKETHVSRLVVKNSIDMRLLSMQADKVRTIDRAMQDTDAAIVEPLSITDLAGLFGHLREKDDGTFVVERDYEKEDEDDEGDSQGSEPEDSQGH